VQGLVRFFVNHNKPEELSSMLKKLLPVTVLLLAITAHSQPAASTHFDGKTWWDYVKVLADDNMEGRETGSAGLRRAQAYIVEQLKEAGVQPAGSDGYYQTVQFRSRQIVEKDCSLALIRDGKAEPLTLGEDAYFSTRVDLASEVEAPLVFVGYGLRIPEKNYDDLAGLDLKGKVAVILNGAPAEIPGALSAHYESAAERWKTLGKAGAVGIVSLPNPNHMEVPWSRMSGSRTRPSMALVGGEFNDTAGEQLLVTFNPTKASLLFDGSGHSFQEILDLAKDRKQLPRFALPVSVKAKTSLERQNLESANVVAKLTGSDPALKNEYVVLSAHIDHLGIGEPVNGDRIYNGAMDNASGSALLLDVAAQLKKSPEKLKRSLLFVFVTGEEKGLLGSKYFAAHPTVPAGAMVADINVDMFLPIVPLKVLTVFGLAESNLGDMAREVAQAHGIGVQPDPEPERNLFVRSDQYNFIRHGIPGLSMDVGAVPGSPEQKIFTDWSTNRYHAPSDDINQPVDLQSAAAYEEVVRDLMIAVANASQRPQWKQDSFFRRYSQVAGK
jgi:Zn-dependent M28 family amino/carboxypeptidase